MQRHIRQSALAASTVMPAPRSATSANTALVIDSPRAARVHHSAGVDATERIREEAPGNDVASSSDRSGDEAVAKALFLNRSAYRSHHHQSACSLRQSAWR